MKIQVTMKWCEDSQQWFMYRKGKFIMKFPDCENMNQFFDGGLNKNRETLYNIGIEPICL